MLDGIMRPTLFRHALNDCRWSRVTCVRVGVVLPFLFSCMQLSLIKWHTLCLHLPDVYSLNPARSSLEGRGCFEGPRRSAPPPQRVRDRRRRLAPEVTAMRACAATAEVAGEQPRTRGRSRRRGERRRRKCVWLNDGVGDDDDADATGGCARRRSWRCRGRGRQRGGWRWRSSVEAQSAVLRLETTTTARGSAVGCDKVEGDDVGIGAGGRPWRRSRFLAFAPIQAISSCGWEASQPEGR